MPKTLLIKFFLLGSTLISLYANDPILTKGEYISAKAHYYSSDFETSYNQFEKLFQEHSDHAYINYYLAMSAIQIGKKDEATAAFERILIKKPDFHRARLEFAKLLLSLGFKDQAKKEFITVLNSDVPKNVKENIQKYLNSINEKLFSLEATIMLGWHYSDNVNNGLENTEFNLPGLSNITVTGAKPLSDNGDVEYLGLNLINKLKGTLIFFQNKLTGYNKNYNDYNSGDLRFYSYQPTIFYSDSQTDSRYSLELNFTKVEPGEFVNDEFKTYSISPQYLTKIFENSFLSTYYKYQRVSYDDEISKDRDYTKKELGLNFYHKQFYLTSNFAKDSKKTGDRTDINKKILQTSLGYRFDLTHGFLLNPEYKYIYTHYKDKDILFDTHRKDKNHTFALSLAKVFNKNNIINMAYAKIKNKTNQDAFKYDKQTTTLSYIRKFQW